VHYLGRFDLSQPGTARFEWSGSGVVARFQGTGIAAALSLDATDFELVIDHGSPSVVSYDGNPATVTLASGLAPGQHTVELYRRDEALWGTSGFGGFTVTGGALVASAPPFSRKIEFIGDSIFAGYGNEGCPFSVGTQNEYLSVGAITARALSAEHITLAWSGIGMSISYDGKTTDQMPVRYERTLPTQSSSAWDFSQWIPDVVVIDLGDNDFTNRDPAQFVATYLDFLVKLRGRYPYAYVLCAMGPMQDLAAWRDQLNSIVSTRNTAGDAWVSFFEFTHDDGSRGRGCDSHPNVLTHQVMADQLVPVVKAKTGW